MDWSPRSALPHPSNPSRSSGACTPPSWTQCPTPFTSKARRWCRRALMPAYAPSPPPWGPANRAGPQLGCGMLCPPCLTLSHLLPFYLPPGRCPLPSSSTLQLTLQCRLQNKQDGCKYERNETGKRPQNWCKGPWGHGTWAASGRAGRMGAAGSRLVRYGIKCSRGKGSQWGGAGDAAQRGSRIAGGERWKAARNSSGWGRAKGTQEGHGGPSHSCCTGNGLLESTVPGRAAAGWWWYRSVGWVNRCGLLLLYCHV